DAGVLPKHHGHDAIGDSLTPRRGPSAEGSCGCKTDHRHTCNPSGKDQRKSDIRRISVVGSLCVRSENDLCQSESVDQALKSPASLPVSMEIVRDTQHYQPLRRTSLTIGNFDGIHLGHRKILGDLVKRARESETDSLVLTFSPHPLKILCPEKAPQLIT